MKCVSHFIFSNDSDKDKVMLSNVALNNFANFIIQIVFLCKHLNSNLQFSYDFINDRLILYFWFSEILVFRFLCLDQVIAENMLIFTWIVHFIIYH